MTVQELYTEIGGSYDSAKKILQMDKLIGKFILKFLNDKSCERLMAAGAARDADGIFEGAHALKGVCANLGLDSLSAAASEVAEAYRPGKGPAMDDATLDASLAQIKTQYDSTIAGIQKFAAAQ